MSTELAEEVLVLLEQQAAGFREAMRLNSLFAECIADPDKAADALHYLRQKDLVLDAIRLRNSQSRPLVQRWRQEGIIGSGSTGVDAALGEVEGLATRLRESEEQMLQSLAHAAQGVSAQEGKPSKAEAADTPARMAAYRALR